MRLEKPFLRFKDEKTFQQAVAGLLARMPGISGVQILHGAQELGKDIVFVSAGPLGEALQCAAVLKNVKLTGAAGSSRSARAALEQLEQALDTPFLDAGGEEARIHRAYLFCPTSISPSTMNSVRGRLGFRAGQVIFISGPELFRLFLQHWPDYLASQRSSLDKHVAELKDQNLIIEPLREVAIQYGLGELIGKEQASYVAPSFHRELRSHTFLNPLTVFLPPPTDVSPLSRLKDSHRDDLKQETPPRMEGWRRWGVWGTSWTAKQMREARRALLLLNNVLRHFSAWGYWLPVGSEGPPNSLSLSESIREFSELLERLWLETVHVAIGQRSFSDSQIAHLKLLFHAPAKLHAAFEVLREEIELGLGLVHESCSMLSRVAEERPRELPRSQLVKCATADDCFRSAPIGTFRSEAGVTINLGKMALQDWDTPLLIVGGPGFGKTSFCRRNAWFDAERLASGEEGLLPLYVPLQRLARREISTIDETFVSEFGHFEPENERMQKVRLYLDGLDEVSDQGRRLKLIQLAKQATEERGWQVVITAREYLYTDRLKWLPRVNISGLEWEDVESLAKQWIASEEARSLFFEQVRQVPGLVKLLSVPLLATLMILVFRQTRRIPENKARIYSMFVDLLSGGWDLAKGLLRASEFGRALKIAFLTRVARQIHAERATEFGVEELARVSKVTIDLGGEATLSALAEELVADGIIERSGSVYRFVHHSFQEFLVAKGMFGTPRAEGVRRALRTYVCGDDWWREVVRLYVGLFDNPKDVVQWIWREVDRISSEADRARVDDLLASVVEAFPGFDTLNVIGYRPMSIGID